MNRLLVLSLFACVWPVAAALSPSVAMRAIPLPSNGSTFVAVFVQGSGPAITGTVTVREGSSVLGSISTSVSGEFDVPLVFSTPGTHILVASYSGDSNWLPAQSPPTTILAVATTVTLTTTGPAGLAFGVHVVVTGAGPCDGTVSLNAGAKVLVSATLNSAGFADISNLPTGPLAVTAAYTSTTFFCASAASPPFSFYSGVPASTTGIVSVTPNPSAFGELPQALVRVTAAVGVATGKVTMKQGSVSFGSGDLDASASVRVTLPSLPVGSWPITAEYAGSPLGVVQASVSAPFTVTVNPALVFVSAAGGQKAIAPDSLATVYGTNLASTAVSAPSLPLPTSLGGVQMEVPIGAAQRAQLLFVSPGQVNFLVPAQAPTGSTKTISLTSGNLTLFGDVLIDTVAPAIFTADGSGSGAPIGILVTAHPDGSQESHPAYACTAVGCQTLPLDVAAADTNVLVLYATGIRNAPLPAVTARIDTLDTPVLFAGAQDQFPGLDQVNLQLPPALAGHGEVTLQITAAGKPANAVKLRFR